MTDTVTDDDLDVLSAELAPIIAALQAGDVTAYGDPHEGLSAPCACVTTAQPSVVWPGQGDDDAVPFGHVQLRYSVLLLVPRDAQVTQTRALNALTVKAIAALTDSYDLVSVSQQGVTTPIGGLKFFGSVLTITTTTREPA